MGNSWDTQSNHIGLTWPKPSQNLLSCLSCPGKLHTHLDSNFMILAGSYLNLFNAEGLVCFPGDSCFAFNNLRKREKGGKCEGERTEGRKKERKKNIVEKSERTCWYHYFMKESFGVCGWMLYIVIVKTRDLNWQ